MLVRRQGSGTFVRRGRVEKNFSKLTSFLGGHAGHAGRNPRQRVAAQVQRATVTPEEALTLARPVPAPRCTASTASAFADDAPMGTRNTRPSSPPCLPVGRCGGVVAVRGARGAPGNRPVARALQRLRAVLFSAEAGGAAGRAKERDAGPAGRAGWDFSTTARAAEFTQSYFRGDIYDFGRAGAQYFLVNATHAGTLHVFREAAQVAGCGCANSCR